MRGFIISRNKKIKILFDAHPLIGNKTGVGYYTQQLIGSLSSNYADDIELIGYYHNFLGRKRISNLPQADNISYRKITLIPGQVVHAANRFNIKLPLELLTLCRADFILYPNFWGQSTITGIPYANVIHDLTYVDVPAFVSDRNAADLNNYVGPFSRKASFVITVSDFSKQRIHEVYKIPLKDIVKTYIPSMPPLKLTAAEATRLLKAQSISGSYILFIGTLEPRKNLSRLLDAYAALPKAIRQSNSLVIAGKIDWKYETTLAKIKSLITSGNNIRYLGYIDDDTRAALYANAACFVLPAVYEGFGMPILEAQSYNVPVCASDIAVFHEIAGNSISYFDPYDPLSIRDALIKTLRNKHTLSTTSAPASGTSWSDVANIVYQRIRKSVEAHRG